MRPHRLPSQSSAAILLPAVHYQGVRKWPDTAGGARDHHSPGVLC